MPDTLKRNLCTPTSRFKDDARSRDAQWFGPVALTLVEVETTGGQIGYGTIGGFTAAGTNIVEHLKPLALGHSVETELLWDKLYRATVRYGRRGVAVSALSAIDIACWDLKGKLLNQPVYNLLGGKTRNRVGVLLQSAVCAGRFGRARRGSARLCAAFSRAETALRFRPWTAWKV